MLINLMHCLIHNLFQQSVFFIGIKTIYMKIMNIAGKGNDLHQEIFPVLLHYQSKTFFY